MPQTVPGKYMGTSFDRHEMMVMGRSQVLRVRSSISDRGTRQRNFSFISMLGFDAVLLCTWEIIFA